MNLYQQFLPRTILAASLALTAMLLGTPSSKAQEIAPDHFTETGVQDIYESAATKAAASNGQQKLLNTQAHKRQSPLLAHRKRHIQGTRRMVAQSRPS